MPPWVAMQHAVDAERGDLGHWDSYNGNANPAARNLGNYP